MQNQASQKKNSSLGLVFILGSMAAIGPLSIDMYLPAFEQMAADLGTDVSTIGYTLTSYFLGIGFGQLIFGPLSDRYGRKLPTLLGLFIFVLTSLAIYFSSSIEAIIGVRVIMALGGGIGIVTSKAIVRDSFEPREMAKFFSTLMLVMGIAPIVAPTIGGYMSAHLGWRSIFLFLAIYSGIIILSITFFLRETKEPDKSISLHPKPVFKDYLKVIAERQFLAYAFAGSMAYAGLFGYLSGASTIYMGYYDLSQQVFGWTFGINAIGYISGAQVNRLLLNRHSSQNISRYMILIQLAIAGLVVASWFSGFGFYYMGLFGIWTFLFFLGFITPNTTTLALSPFKRFAGSASALIGSMQMVFGSMISGLVSIFNNGTPEPVIIVMCLCSAAGAAIMWYYTTITPQHTFDTQNPEL